MYDAIDELMTLVETRMDDVEPDFQTLLRCVLDALHSIGKKVKGRDLHVHQEAWEVMIRGEIQAVLDLLLAKDSVDKPDALVRSLQSYECLQARFNLQLARDSDGDSDGDSSGQEDLAHPAPLDSSTMLQCMDELNACLKRAYEELKEYIEAEEEQLAQNKAVLETCTERHRSEPQNVWYPGLPPHRQRCVKEELREQKQAVSLQQSRVDAMRQATLETKAGVERDEAARQDVLVSHLAAFMAESNDVTWQQAKIGEEIDALAPTYSTWEANRVELAQLARHTKSLQVDCSKEFNKKKCLLEGTSSKLAAEALDLHALQDVLDIQLRLTEQVMEKSVSLVQYYSRSLEDAISDHRRKLKQLFDAQYELCVRRTVNFEMHRLKIATTENRLEAVTEQVHEYNKRKMELDHEWEKQFKGIYSDQRDHIEVDVHRRFLPRKYDYSRPLGPNFAVANGEAERDCVICMSVVHANDRNRMASPCDHLFHSSCLRKWMEIKLECPTCRRPIPAP